MTVKELKKILARAKDDTYIEVISKVGQGKQHFPIANVTYDKTWDSWQLNIE